MHHPTDRIAHTTAFVTPVMEHWLEREIAQWVHPMKDRSDDPSHHERTHLQRSYYFEPSFTILHIYIYCGLTPAQWACQKYWLWFRAGTEGKISTWSPPNVIFMVKVRVRVKSGLGLELHLGLAYCSCYQYNGRTSFYAKVWTQHLPALWLIDSAIKTSP